MIAWLQRQPRWLMWALVVLLGLLGIAFLQWRSTAKMLSAALGRERLAKESAERERAVADATRRVQEEHDRRRAEIAATLEARKHEHTEERKVLEAERDQIVTEALKPTGSVAEEAIRRREARKLRGEL